jgi:hypothetical protein
MINGDSLLVHQPPFAVPTSIGSLDSTSAASMNPSSSEESSADLAVGEDAGGRPRLARVGFIDRAHFTASLWRVSPKRRTVTALPVSVDFTGRGRGAQLV